VKVLPFNKLYPLKHTMKKKENKKMLMFKKTISQSPSFASSSLDDLVLR